MIRYWVFEYVERVDRREVRFISPSSDSRNEITKVTKSTHLVDRLLQATP